MKSPDRPTKVLVISFVEPFPADDGKKVVLQGLLRDFSERSNTQVAYVILGGAGSHQPSAAHLTFHSLSHRTRRIQPLTALLQSVFRRRPLQQTLLYSDELRQAIRRQMTAIEPDIVIYDTIRVSQFVEDPRALLPDARHILYLDDLFSVRYEAMLQAMHRYPLARVRPLGNFAKHLPAVCQPILNIRPICRYLLRREMRLVKEAEDGEVAKFDLSLLVNRSEVKLLQERSAQQSIAVLPIVLHGHNQPPPTRTYRGGPEFVFVGALNVAHNQCSIEYFIANIFDECVRSIPGLKLRVIGQAPSDDLRALFARFPKSIEWTAWAADLGEVFSPCAAMLVPLLFGSGVKIKTLEALCHALPVISTQFGAEGIVSDPAEASGVIVENDLKRFPQRMRALLDPHENDRVSREARAYYAANYSAEAGARQFGALWGCAETVTTGWQRHG